ncbi:MAG: phosphotransferase [Magnetococcales bacterium]|nr:phosphotransferase [Magnetococcales bacterium]
MGVIKKVLYRGQILGKPRHRNLFLDMEENIHIHYRDLRIELSRSEFEEISETFRKQSAELQAIIHEKEYQDGKLANANQDDVRIWTESQLKHEVTYHPRRVSIEACSDGYHLHYRNYKILIDEADFRELARQFQRLDPDAPCASTYAEVLELLEANELDFILDSGNAPAETMSLRVAAHHLPKVRDIFKLIGFTHEATPEGSLYQGNPLKVLVRGEKKGSGLDFRALRGLNHTERLVEFLSRHGAGLDPNLLNRIKCQVLDLYHSLTAGQPAYVACDPQFWLYSPASGRVIFPHSATSAGPEAAKTLYRAWSALLTKLDMAFIKPTKVRFDPEAQQALQQRVTDTLLAEVASRAAVNRVYLMGSALRGEMGYYLAPFVHGPNAKLGSDVDILIEIHPEREQDLPANWQLINPESASSGCAVYHITQIPMARDTSAWSTLHPHLPFMQHLVDAYIFFPSKGNREAKDAFLKKFNAKVVHDRLKNGIVPASGPIQDLTRQVRERYGMPDAVVEPMRVSTENLLYKIFRGENETILKLFKVAGNYHSKRIVEHTAYEEALIHALVARGVETARILPALPGSASTVDGHPALLFERIPGLPQSKPEYPLDKIGAALAHLHRVQINDPVPLPAAFTFEESCQIWLPYFATYQVNPILSPELQTAFAQLAPRVQPFLDESYRQTLHQGMHQVHNHGDVTPKNVIITPEGLTCFFDFNNCYHGPRVLDLLDGGFEFSLADKYIHLADFARFDALLTHYAAHAPLNEAEIRTLPRWILLVGIIKFIKEVRVLVERPKEALRRQRALAIAGFLATRDDGVAAE